MGELDIHKIKELALKSKRRVFSIKDLSVLLNKPENAVRVYVTRLVRKGLAKKIEKGIIAFTDNDYIISNQLVEPSYISMNSALNYLDLLLQVPKTVEVVCTKQVKFKSDYEYYKINSKLFFGYTKELAEGTYYFVAEPEKAIIDLIYFNGFSEDYLKDFLPKLDLIKLRNYIKKYVNIKGYRANRVLKIGDYIDKQRKLIKNSKN